MRRLVAALACRMQGSRLYGKPLQNLDIEDRVTILDHLVSLIRTIPVIQDIVLGISEGNANLAFVDYAKSRRLDHIIGDQKNVLQRLIDCGKLSGATDIFRVTTESPFFYFDMVEKAWQRHVQTNNDVTTLDGLPEGSHFEIYTLQALTTSHELGEDKHRSEYCSLYIRENLTDFKVDVLPIPPELERLDLRLTVDYPEDLVLCRRIYRHLKHQAPRLALIDIIDFLDNHPELKILAAPYVVQQRLWPRPQ